MFHDNKCCEPLWPNFNLLLLYRDPRTYWHDAAQSCKNVLDELATNFQQVALQMADASTNIPSGILTGSVYDLGNFDQCLRIKQKQPDISFQGQHCQAQLSIPMSSGVLKNAIDYTPEIKWSYCIPNVCSNLDLEKALKNLLSSSLNVTVNVTVNQKDCATGVAKNWSTGDIFSIALCSIVLLLCLISTFYDLWIQKYRRTGNRIKAEKAKELLLTAFSFYSNGKRLFKLNESADSIKVLHGLRFLSIVWVILGHRYLFSIEGPLMNLFELMSTVSERIDLELIINAVLAVDTFFFLSGFLNAYHLFKLLRTTRKFPWAYFYIHRYIRLTPSLAVVILITIGWYNLIGDGPLWSKITTPGKELCEKNWWSTLLYINNYYNPIQQCAGQSWYLAVDMQLFWLSPLVILPCWKWPKIAKCYLFLLLTLSVLAVFIVAYEDEMRMAFTFSRNLAEYQKVTQLMYVPTHTRTTPYIMGIMFGLFVQKRRNSTRKLNISQPLVVLTWLLSSAICLSVVLGNYPFVQTLERHPYNRWESSLYISLHRLGWSLGIGWIIVACIFGYGGPVSWVLSWSVFVPLSRVTYCIFLCHMMVQHYQVATMRTTNYYTPFQYIHSFFGDLFTAVLASILLSLMFESPVLKLEKLLFRRNVKHPGNLEGQTNKSFAAENTKI